MQRRPRRVVGGGEGTPAGPGGRLPGGGDVQRRPRRAGGAGGCLLGLAAGGLLVAACNAGRAVQVAGGAPVGPGGSLPGCGGVQPRPRRAGGGGRALACLVAAYLVVAACSHDRGVQVVGGARWPAW